MIYGVYVAIDKKKQVCSYLAASQCTYVVIQPVALNGESTTCRAYLETYLERETVSEGSSKALEYCDW